MSLSGWLNRRHLCLVLISAGLLAFQIALLQILATSQWHHFANFVISIALLGFGSAGTALSLARSWLVARQQQLLPLLLCASAVTLAAALGLTQRLIGGFDSLLLFVAPGEMLRLAGVAFLLMLPFFFGALAIGLVFTVETERIGSYYFANLLGSGLGTLLGLVGLTLLLPQQLPPYAALLALAAGGVLLPGATTRATRIGMLLGLALVVATLFQPTRLQLSQYKDLSRALDLPEATIVAHRPAASGQVHIVASPVLRNAPGVSLNWSGAIPRSQAVFINGDLVGSLPPPPGADNPRDASTYALAYALRTPHQVLVLNAGTGADVAQAVAKGAGLVVAVEAHGALTEVLRSNAPQSFGRLLVDPRVSWQSASPRTWLARDRQSYDLVILPEVGGFGGNSGLFALHEQPLLTREALQQAWQRLTLQGVLTVTAWVDYPVRSPVRLLASLVETLVGEGVADPVAHIAALRSWGTVTFCLKRSAYTAEELDRIRAFAARWAFDPVLLPDLQPQERQRYNRLQDDSLFTLFDATIADGRESLYRDYALRVWPVSDDQPFFSQFLRWGRLGTLAELYGQRSLPFLELGMLVSGLAALVLAMLAALLIMLPLTRLARQQRHSWQTPLYFGGLGLGYMWTELALIHSFVFYLGQPVYAATLVVGVLLAGSAIGSALTDRFNNLQPRRWAAVVAVTLGLYALLLTPLLQATLPLPLLERVTLAVLILIPAAVVMGMPFPLGLRLLNRVHSAEVPWAWGINGCFSVVGAAVATLIA
ncbi:MAG: hypothetical protein OEL80_04330, partial [Desulfuromonadales bacterium]|nr:hypothetical protein [Desulfuromonadales bacterium]